MAARGMCSRREADKFISQGLVFVDGVQVSQLGTKICPSQCVTLSPDALQQQAKLATVLINKPPGYVSGLPEKGYRSAVMLIDRNNAYHPGDAVPSRVGMAPAGRLDIDSTGLIVFTQDGRIAKQLIGEHSEIEKEYLVKVTGKITEPKIGKLRYGLSLDGKALKHATVKRVKESTLQFILTEGRKRQIRRMLELVELQVVALTRIRIGRISLNGLPRGKWRTLHAEERF